MDEKKKPGQQMRLTDVELSLIKNTFSDNEDLLRLMRKIFLPELDATIPLGQNLDLWMTIPLEGLTNEQAIVNIKARNTLIQHLDMQLNVLKLLAENQEITPEQAVTKLRKDSNK